MGKLALAVLFVVSWISSTPLRADTYPAVLVGLKMEQFDQVMKFVIGNERFALFHEFGHLLVSELDLPVLGREEDAVDALSTVHLLNNPDPELKDAVWRASVGWMMFGRMRDASGSPPAYWDEHGIDQQRAFNVICLMLGKEALGNDVNAMDGTTLANVFQLPEGRRNRCPREYNDALRSWGGLIASHMTKKPVANDIALNYFPPENEKLNWWAQRAKDNHLLEKIQTTLSNFDLKPGIRLTARQCNDENAYWSREDRELTLCYELLPFFAAAIVNENRAKWRLPPLVKP